MLLVRVSGYPGYAFSYSPYFVDWPVAKVRPNIRLTAAVVSHCSVCVQASCGAGLLWSLEMAGDASMPAVHIHVHSFGSLLDTRCTCVQNSTPTQTKTSIFIHDMHRQTHIYTHMHTHIHVHTCTHTHIHTQI